jgi:hypothetical protein
MQFIRIAVCVLALSSLAYAQAPTDAAESPTVPTLPDVNPDVLRAVIADQWDRGMDMFGGRPAKVSSPPDWNAIASRDKERQATVRGLVATGKLSSARDFQFAALVFQHSESASDVRLAHLLAVTAALKGQPTAKWLAAAAFDRYLWNTNQPQIFGTQFKQTGDGDATWTMDPYDTSALSDSIRAEWCVVSLSEEQAALAALKAGRPPNSTTTSHCK